MLNIPDEVKALFSSDTAHKNFHVHFPNGEYTDLNNEDIVSESVQFTESLCSQQYFKFGLAEASQIEFVAVGIPNVRGSYIECAIEIDCTSLGTAWAETHLPDLTLSFLTPQTCFYNEKLYYRVPYGRFRVDTCPRDHGAMWQRQITAYSDGVKDKIEDGFEVRKEATFGTSSKYALNVVGYVNSLVYGGNSNELESIGYTKISTSDFYKISVTADDIEEPDILLVLLSGTNKLYRFVLHGDLRQGKTSSSVYTPAKTTIAAVGKFPDYHGVFVNYIKNMVTSESINLEASGYDSAEDLADYIWNLLKLSIYAVPRVEYQYGNNVGTSYFQLSDYDCGVAYRDEKVSLYRYIVPEQISVQRHGGGEYTWITACTFEYSPMFYYEKDDTSSPLDALTLSVKHTLVKKVGKISWYSFANAFSLVDATIGFLELSGWFLKPARGGILDYFQMSENPTAIAVSASDWSSFWWDETPIDSIGLVNVIYTQDGEEQQQSFNIGDGNSVYTIENNEVLKNAALDETTMQSILTTYFEPNASVINFTPTELEMRGLPYLESGDYIELTAEDGETVQTYILNQTISGIQNLRANVTSTTGALLEVVDNE